MDRTVINCLNALNTDGVAIYLCIARILVRIAFDLVTYNYVSYTCGLNHWPVLWV